LVGADGVDFPQLAKPPMQAGTKSAAAPTPICEKNAFLSIFFFFKTKSFFSKKNVVVMLRESIYYIYLLLI
jgi:hypothetical protein